MVLRFGKWKGHALRDVPEDYLRWLNGEEWVREPLRAAVEAELDNRTWARRMEDAFRARAKAGTSTAVPKAGMADPETAAALIKRGYRALSLEAHPDQGGTHEEMIRLTATKDWLLAVAGKALPSRNGAGR